MHNTERLAGNYTAYEQAELASYPMGVPSPRGSRWKTYTKSRLKTLGRGLAVYATSEYAQIRLTQYINSTRAMDEIAKTITNNIPSVVHIGGAQMSPNSPIGMSWFLFDFVSLFHSSGNINVFNWSIIFSLFVQVSRKTSVAQVLENWLAVLRSSTIQSWI